MIDIALKTGVAGDLTRRLVESSQAISVTEVDCGTKEGILVKEEAGNEPLVKRA
jgi:DNA-directed RNA polymerase subunit beta'